MLNLTELMDIGCAQTVVDSDGWMYPRQTHCGNPPMAGWGRRGKPRRRLPMARQTGRCRTRAVEKHSSAILQNENHDYERN